MIPTSTRECFKQNHRATQGCHGDEGVSYKGAATAANKGVLTPQPCKPKTSEWIGGKSNVKLEGKPALMTDDHIFCMQGAGMIEVKDSGQQAVIPTTGDLLGTLSTGADFLPDLAGASQIAGLTAGSVGVVADTVDAVQRAANEGANVNRQVNTGIVTTVIGATGLVAGAKAGVALGTLVGPGIGTVGGAVVGGAVGLVGSLIKEPLADGLTNSIENRIAQPQVEREERGSSSQNFKK
jgi:hypothetical protein